MDNLISPSLKLFLHNEFDPFFGPALLQYRHIHPASNGLAVIIAYNPKNPLFLRNNSFLRTPPQKAYSMDTTWLGSRSPWLTKA
jgi:hypothetical protein